MTPQELTPQSFASYPAEARILAEKHLATLRRLPLGFAPLLLKELVVYDYRFPMERRDLNRQMHYLESLDAARFEAALAPFVKLRLSRELEQTEWVSKPAVFTEQLTAHLWTTHQIDAFRKAAVDYVDQATAAFPDEPLPTHRVGIVAIGQGVRESQYRLFRKLRAQGTYFTNIKPGAGAAGIAELLARRAAKHPEPYAHWYIDGGAAMNTAPAVAKVSWAGLTPVRASLQSRMQKIYEAPVWDPEAFRTKLAQIQPEELGMKDGADAALTRFQLSLLTEGSGTQIFSTTFVQWAAREALRRAQPLTLFARFAPRQRDKAMNELLAEAQKQTEFDPEGSLVDADMGAWYTWLNQQRLPGAEKANFLAWFEGHGEGVAIGPGFAKASVSADSVNLTDLVAKLA